MRPFHRNDAFRNIRGDLSGMFRRMALRHIQRGITTPLKTGLPEVKDVFSDPSFVAGLLHTPGRFPGRKQQMSLLRCRPGEIPDIFSHMPLPEHIGCRMQNLTPYKGLVFFQGGIISSYRFSCQEYSIILTTTKFANVAHGASL